MGIINSLTNPDKLVESKAGFFADYFYFYASRIGLFYKTPLETPLSLIGKILYQLGTDYSGNKWQYVRNHLSHNFFQHDGFLRQFKNYKRFNVQAKAFLSFQGKDAEKTKWFLCNPDFEKRLLDLKEELEREMTGKALRHLLTYFLCKHELKQHKKHIKYLTSILVSEAFFCRPHKT